MPHNRITVNFTVCTPTPENGYNVFYRPFGSVEAYRNGGNFTASPAVIDDTVENVLTRYEGYIQSECPVNSGGQVTFSTPDLTVHTRNVCMNDTTGCGCEIPNVPIYYLGNAGTDPLVNGTIIYYDAALTTKVLDHPFMYKLGIFYTINQTTGAVTVGGAC